MKELPCPTCKIELMAHEASSCLEEWLYGSMGFERISSEAWKENESQYWRMGISKSIDAAFWFMQRKIWKMAPETLVTRDSIIGWYASAPDKPRFWISISGLTFPIRVCRVGIYMASDLG